MKIEVDFSYNNIHNILTTLILEISGMAWKIQQNVRLLRSHRGL